MYTYTHKHRVRYRECDPMGVVYHTHYLDYFEAARTEALRHLGIPYRELEERGIMMPVIEANISYHRPAHYDERLHIITRFETLPQVRVPIDYEVQHAESGNKLVTGRVTLCFIDSERRRPTAPPAPIAEAFEKAFQQVG